ncbi:MAG TPA: CopG family antitoxin [Ktedonobacteraceae bacterium]|nr:CopG family antitoxin [Ktedonobacteraceae bacterium]
MQDNNNAIPHFDNEDEEREFWATHDSTGFFHWDGAEEVPSFHNLKPSTRSVPRWRCA